MIESLFARYRNMSNPVKASFWFVLSNVLIKGISIITLPIFSRILLPEEYGIIYVYQTWMSIISVFTTLGLWGGVFKVSISKYPSSKDKIVSTYQGLATTITLFVAFFAILFNKQISNILQISPLLVCCIFIEIFVQIPLNMWTVNNQFDYNYKPVVLITIMNSILIPLLSYICVISFPENRAEAKVIGGLIIQLIESIYIFVKNIVKGKKYFDKELWRFGFSFNVILIPHYLSLLVLSQSDRIMISRMCGSYETGLYSMAYTFAMLITLVSNGVEASLTPYIYKSIASENTNKLTKFTNSVILLMCVLSIMMMCFVPDVFMILLPKVYYDSIIAIPPVVAGAFFMFIYPLFGAIEFYYNENRFVTIASCFGALLNIILNYIFIDRFGYIAAAYTTMVCYIIFACAHYIFMKQVLKKNKVYYKIYDIRFVLFLSLTIMMVTIIMEYVYGYFYIRWGLILICSVIMFLFRKKIIDMVKFFVK